jgi:hypothetical protein
MSYLIFKKSSIIYNILYDESCPVLGTMEHSCQELNFEIV